MKKIVPILGIVVATSTVATFAFAKPKLDAFAERLATLRAEVESLSADVEQKKEAKRTRLRSLANQKADLEFQIQREERRIAQLRAQAEKKREKLAEQNVESDEIRPAVVDSMTAVKKKIRHGLPFKRAERLGAVDELEDKMNRGLVSPQKASVQLWSLVEDELRLTRENGLYRQVVTLEGEEMLVEVARLGMVGMYFRADDGRVGHVRRAEDGWEWVELESERDRRQVADLFEAMRKQIRTGFFELPGPIGGER
jgi:outer membrane murein-binding lipoprotein Lpp